MFLLFGASLVSLSSHSGTNILERTLSSETFTLVHAARDDAYSARANVRDRDIRATCTSSTYVGDVRERSIGVRLKIPVLKARAPAQPALRPAAALRLHCGRENACPSAAARPLLARASYIELFPSVSTVIARCLRHELELPIPNRFASSSGKGEGERDAGVL